MNCNVIKDLLPLYIDECCSGESALLISEHIESCATCRKVYECMRSSSETHTEQQPSVSLHPVNSWKASLLQAIMLFMSFAIMTVGVILEGSTPIGYTNGTWAFTFIVPATGYLLSLANWFFLRIYKSRKAFSNGSLVATVAFIALGYAWAVLHYRGGVSYTSVPLWGGIAFSAAFCILSKILSNQYALLLGRE